MFRKAAVPTVRLTRQTVVAEASRTSPQGRGPIVPTIFSRVEPRRGIKGE